MKRFSVPLFSAAAAATTATALPFTTATAKRFIHFGDDITKAGTPNPTADEASSAASSTPSASTTTADPSNPSASNTNQQQQPPHHPRFEPFPMIDKLLDRHPLAIARAITLVESSNPLHAGKISALLKELKRRRLVQEAERRRAVRLAAAAAAAANSNNGRGGGDHLQHPPYKKKKLLPPPDALLNGHGFDDGTTASGRGGWGTVVPDGSNTASSTSTDASASPSSSSASQDQSSSSASQSIASLALAPHNELHSLFGLNLEANRSHPVGSMRIAISGSPGAGKSTFIEALGTLLTDTYGLRVGVIAVDPSSVVSGGSLLGDKTRMEKLSTSPNAFVRPSPSRGHLGGVTARCWETMEIFESANFDVILVETVGVGQSEIAARNMTDLFLLLVPPASGDELQGIKKGIVEVADVIVVTKCDGERVPMAKATQMAYARAVMFHKNSHNIGGGGGESSSNSKSKSTDPLVSPHRAAAAALKAANKAKADAEGGGDSKSEVKSDNSTTAAAAGGEGGEGGGDATTSDDAPEAEEDRDAIADALKPVMCISSEDVSMKNQNSLHKGLNNSMNTNSVALLWNRVERMWLRRRDQGRLSALRKRQCMDHFNEYFNQELINSARTLLGEAYLRRLEDEVVGKNISPRQAGDIALKAVLREEVTDTLPVIPK